jgi:hypothetical protein
MGIVWRPLALVASLAAAAVAVVMLWAYLVAAHDTPAGTRRRARWP